MLAEFGERIRPHLTRLYFETKAVARNIFSDERGSLSDREIGPHGPIFREFYHDAKGAIAKLRELQTGDAVAALYHAQVGDIDLIWGEEGATPGKGFGLAKLLKWHPDVVEDLQEHLNRMAVVSRNENTIQLESDTHHAVVRRNWKGDPKTRLLTAFEKKSPSASGRRMDISGTPTARRDDTAPPPSGRQRG